MYQKSFYHTLSDGTKVKFTIREKTIDGEAYYYANVVNTEQDSYKSLPEEQQKTHYGTEITDRDHNLVLYRDPVQLLNVLLQKFGEEWIPSEK
jgi:hypothetical protein